MSENPIDPEDTHPTPAGNESFHEIFAGTYLSNWQSAEARDWLDARRDEGIYYEGFDDNESEPVDGVKLNYKHLLNSIVRVTQIGQEDFMIQFSSDTPPGLNSDCMAAVEDFIAVLLCESGAETFPESKALIADCETRFPGLGVAGDAPRDRLRVYEGGLVGRQIPAMGYNVVSVSVPGHGEEVGKALRALLRQVRLEKGLPAEDPDDLPPQESGAGGVNVQHVVTDKKALDKKR